MSMDWTVEIVLDKELLHYFKRRLGVEKENVLAGVLRLFLR